MSKIWEVFPSDIQKIELFTKNLGISPVLSQLLLNRGIADLLGAEKFLFSSFYGLPDSFRLKDMAKAVERVKQSIQRKEHVMILSDYDVDGITSLALLYEFFNSHNVSASYYLPHRIEEGYGVSKEAVKSAIDGGVSLFITLDCGITAFEEVKLLKDSGIDVLIIDHHRPHGDVYPKADAIIDPWQNGCEYPDKDLAAVGLVFKFLQALLGHQNEKLMDFLDLVCLGTVADVSGLRGENRVLVKEGLKILKNTKRKGLKELFKVAGLKQENISVRNISFIMAPRLNAAGRIDSAEGAFRLLVTESEEEAQDLAGKLDAANKKRRLIESDILKQANVLLEGFNFSENKVIVVYGENWHMGVLGIVASRLADTYYRPCIVLSESKGLLKGSGRSIPEFNIFQAVSDCCEILEEFGGHAAACGVALKKKNLNEFKEELNKYVSCVYEKAPFIPKLKLDRILGFNDISDSLFEDIEVLSPYGAENPEPRFMTESVKVITKPRALARKFYKFWVKKNSLSFQALFKSKDASIPQEGELIDIAYTPSEGEWEGVKSVTLFLEDYRKAEKV
ncbi:MAG: single-stranded-DNA-specific exonuclease RecJ [Candidatus Saelkia tenebricola]|nr:single-stranded-DNA-specific exonuclease RecJ [Candidatus Saelkia tenebricola]